MSSGLRVLVVDDEPQQRALVRRLFERAGLSDLVEAGDAEDAVRQAGEHQPDLILLDLQMPGRTGLEALPDLRQACPGATVVVLSNLPQRSYEADVVAAGAVGYVEKREAAERLVGEVLAAASLSAAVVDRITVDLQQSPTAPGQAREAVRSLLGAEDAELVDVVELLVTELVTNSVVHAASAPRVEVDLRRDVLRVAVHDTDPVLPHQRVPDLDRPGGRGMLLLERLSARWGAEPTEGGKVVWFELDRR